MKKFLLIFVFCILFSCPVFANAPSLSVGLSGQRKIPAAQLSYSWQSDGVAIDSDSPHPLQLSDYAPYTLAVETPGAQVQLEFGTAPLLYHVHRWNAELADTENLSASWYELNEHVEVENNVFSFADDGNNYIYTVFAEWEQGRSIYAFRITTPDPIRVSVNGRQIIFVDQNPIIIDGRTFVPVRGVFENLGFSVEWQAATSSVLLSRGNFFISLQIGEPNFIANSVSHPLDVPAQIINGRTMLPLRAVLESAGYSIAWDAATRTVLISEE
ncbi:MAG: copper amine oxidase N-terminal domain-containing protein [Clostridiales bacterium]|jgi:hypothetical protein|nr:copper amine oxidase N-terminal domain-containing protein [Clostridiales bacterium]